MKLSKLPDRNAVRITFSAMPDLNLVLQEYAEFYQATYGEAAAVPDLVAPMLTAFMESDRDFAKARKVTTPAQRGDQRPAAPRKEAEPRS